MHNDDDDDDGDDEMFHLTVQHVFLIVQLYS